MYMYIDTIAKIVRNNVIKGVTAPTGVTNWYTIDLTNDVDILK